MKSPCCGEELIYEELARCKWVGVTVDEDGTPNFDNACETDIDPQEWWFHCSKCEKEYTAEELVEKK